MPWGVALLWASVLWRRRRRFRRSGPLTAALLVTGMLTCWSAPSSAQDTLSELKVGLGARRWTGAFAERVSPGFGFEVSQELYQRGIGAGARLGVYGYLSKPVAGEPLTPPFNRNMQTYHFQIGPRLRRLLWRGIFVGASVEYVRLGMGGSSLVDLTGFDRAWHTVAAGGKVGYEMAPLVMELELTYTYIPQLSGDLLGVVASVGVKSF